MDAKELRKQKVEEKRRKLAELRRLKQERSEAASASSVSTPSPAVETPLPPPEKNVNIDSLVEELLGNQTKGGNQETTAPVQAVPIPEKEEVPRKPVSLSVVSKVYCKHIQPASFETYAKGTQTDDIEPEEPKPKEIGTSPMSPAPTGRKHAPPTPINQSTEPEEKEEPYAETNEVEMTPDLSTDEREVIENSDDFLHFIEQSARVLERTIALNTQYDVTIDYGGENVSAQPGDVEVLHLASELVSPDHTNDSSVSCLGWSNQFNELFLASYSKRDRTAESDWKTGSSADGLVLIWNMKSSERPEYVFTCQSEVETAMFNPFMPSVVLGGTYSGEIVMWDMRAKSTPVQRSSLASDGHMHPVFAMDCVGTANAHSLVSVSTDGKLCLWSLSSMAAPTESRMLQSENTDVAVTSISFPTGESNVFCAGAEDGKIHRTQVHSSKTGTHKGYSSHFGPVTNVDFHKCKGGSGVANDLLLSSSMDWTVKLWSHRHSEVPLKTFESASDYVYSAQWSPVHPALFASVDGAGYLDLWNLNQDLEVPIKKFQLSTSSALSTLQWAPDGRSMVVGDSHGKLSIVNVSSDVAVPKRDDWSALEDVVSELAEAVQKDPASF